MTSADFAAVQSKAADGDAPSEGLVCLATRSGIFVAEDDTKAFPMCLAAAKQGNLLGLENAASMYLFGRGTTQDTAAAVPSVSARRQAGL